MAFTIHVGLLSGHYVTVNVDREDTVEVLRLRAAEVVNTNIGDLVLSDGRVLDCPHLSVSEVGLKDGDSVVATIRQCSFTMEEVRQHCQKDDCWIVFGLEGRLKVFDVTHFLDNHPGGGELILDVCGRDCSADFEDIAHTKYARDIAEEYLIGEIAGPEQDEYVKRGPKPSQRWSSRRIPAYWTPCLSGIMVAVVALAAHNLLKPLSTLVS
eukprot:TRINITY_DN73484_c0_g1_i1.p1 TRINITY_DN73484_c0_g1~~TRINITY_DN73484_c0_g1_i1.p1  ORF type:complete len:211 (+),score=32.03 TRINITY_DN73484_c0_g1_i1:39-671(+)